MTPSSELAARISIAGIDDGAADIVFCRFDHDGAPHLEQPCSHSPAIWRVDQPSRLAAFQTMPNSSPASPSKTSSQLSHSNTIRSCWRSIIFSPPQGILSRFDGADCAFQFPSDKGFVHFQGQ